MVSAVKLARCCFGGWFAGTVTLLIGSSFNSPSTSIELRDVSLLAFYASIVTFGIGFPIALLTTRMVTRHGFRFSPLFGTIIGTLASLGVLVLVALPFYGSESVGIIFGFLLTPIVGGVAVAGGATGLILAIELRIAANQH